MIRRLAFILAATALFGCKKNALLPAHIMGDWTENYTNTLMIHQAVGLYDSTALRDSIDFVQPPTNRIYRWDASPDSAGIHFAGDYLHGKPDVSFDHPGVYRISARIYDSATGRELARTNPFTLDVTTDTLHPATAIANNEQLNIQCCGVQHELYDTATIDYIFSLEFVTTNSYIGYSAISYQLTTGAGIEISFADSAAETYFPYLPYYPVYFPIQTYVAFQNIPVGSIQPFSIIWLDKTYTGTVSRPVPEQLIFGWDNSGPVRFTSQ